MLRWSGYGDFGVAKMWSRFAVRCLTFAMQNDPLPFSAPLNLSQMESSRPASDLQLVSGLITFDFASAGAAFSAINADTDGGRRLGHRQQARAELCLTTPHGIGRNHLNTAVRAKAVDKAAAKRARRQPRHWVKLFKHCSEST